MISDRVIMYRRTGRGDDTRSMNYNHAPETMIERDIIFVLVFTIDSVTSTHICRFINTILPIFVLQRAPKADRINIENNTYFIPPVFRALYQSMTL